jgi:hypothetical protein
MTRRMAEAVSEGFRLAGSALDSISKDSRGTDRRSGRDDSEDCRGEKKKKKDDNSFYIGGSLPLDLPPMGEPRFRVGPRDAARGLAFLLTSY